MDEFHSDYTHVHRRLHPMIWWLYFGLRHLTRNQPVSEMTGLALWFGYGVLNMPTGVPSKDPYADLQNVIHRPHVRRHHSRRSPHPHASIDTCGTHDHGPSP